MSKPTDTKPDSSVNPTAAFGHVTVKVWQKDNFVQEVLNPADAPDTNSKLVNLVPGEFRVYVAISPTKRTAGNVTCFTVDIDGTSMAQLCVPQEHITTEVAYMSFIQSYPNTDTKRYVALTAPEGVKEVRVTARAADGGLQKVSNTHDDKVLPSIKSRKKHWMLVEPYMAAEVPVVGGSMASADVVTFISTPSLNMLGPEVVYKFKVEKLDGEDKNEIRKSDPERRAPLIQRE
ncbi:hypothetical protein CLAFUW4_14633 [Fulvia fulva]|uniref:Uncharacterized protein n=1 Tax=Passalora fulva TaxID=5499 RepID=A0A9Q8PM19_PASFU|nr:uncharacterized protein CLAFUR5_14462 [Fulvia fulva]KAK4609076.1 hypothetical protein CLAFUR4_14627 [Fulvia fulva]KAK4609838.1 hypothetical protein CLAFUR0_14627 [Fulvia fulva]UJO24913.1 hypothetical protein CLAFUR5_14462 [Fulvia fulva]WPV22604.1 hypothetical protein CLAFUW4_14633 [Fulvia fulva]WPV37566.1 hypothetical protein CLAFUW7_14636 [Fulvia fulva]